MQQLVGNVFKFIALIVLMLLPTFLMFGMAQYNRDNEALLFTTAAWQSGIFLLVAIFVAWCVYLVYRNTLPEKSFFRIFPQGSFQTASLLWCIPYLIAMLSLAGLHGMLTEWFTGQTLENGLETDNQVAIMTLMENLPAAVMVADVVFLAPIVEELLFRGIFFHYFNTLSKSKRIVAWLLSSACFAAMHLSQLNWDFLLYFSMGLILGSLYWHTRDLRYSILVHMVNNAIGLVSMYFAV